MADGRLCRLCNERPVPPSRLLAGDYRCSNCRNNSPSHRRTRRKYGRSEKRHALERARNKKRIFIGRDYHSTARTVEDATRINAHIKERMIGFKQRQSQGAAVEADPPHAISAETGA